MSVDCGYDGLLHLNHVVDELFPIAHCHPSVARLPLAGVHALKIAARAECPASASEHNYIDIIIPVYVGEDVLQLTVELRVYRIEGFRPV